jgi:hypothetical protein
MRDFQASPTQEGIGKMSHTETAVAYATIPTQTPKKNQRARDTWWNSEGRTELLVQRWTEGEFSAAQIATELSEDGRYPVTRSAVIGKANRLQLPGRQPRSHAPYTPRKRQVKTPQPPKLVSKSDDRPSLPSMEIAPLPNVPPVELVDLEHNHCRYPVGSSEMSGLMLYCGASRYEAFPYCEHHAAKCYKPDQRK